MNEAILDFTTDDFREEFLHSIFDYLHENGINLYRIEDVLARYQENKIAHSINMALSMVIERIVDNYLLSQNILKEEQLATELDSEFSIEVNPSTGKPHISSKYKFLYKEKNLNFVLDCQFELDEMYDNEKLDEMIEKITMDVENQLSK
ncbi:hypothetical protein ACFOU2_21775 [Bacillus songklensis]|uniref:Uncharacterized protein n=1 Tax=Bacillus songklensis TaxID=1069116 RepID=A0ABV8B9Z7_9BACI